MGCVNLGVGPHCLVACGSGVHGTSSGASGEGPLKINQLPVASVEGSLIPNLLAKDSWQESHLYGRTFVSRSSSQTLDWDIFHVVDLRVGRCLSKCSLRLKLCPQYAQKTILIDFLLFNVALRKRREEWVFFSVVSCLGSIHT